MYMRSAEIPQAESGYWLPEIPAGNQEILSRLATEQRVWTRLISLPRATCHVYGRGQYPPRSRSRSVTTVAYLSLIHI